MNASSTDEQGVFSLVEIIELKWLLAAEGMHLHVERLQADRDYACSCLTSAEASANPVLRRVAHRLRQKLACARPA